MSLLSYSGVTTKVRSMSGKLMSTEDYRQLSSITSVQEYVNFLKQRKAYEDIFAQVNVDTLHRGDIEKMLTKGIYKDFERIYRFSNQKQREFLDLYFLRFQVQVVKSCLRMVFDKRNPELNLDMFQSFFMKHSGMDLSKLTNSETIEELISNLKGTVFYQPLGKLLSIEHGTLFDFEMQLDLFYFVTIYKNCSKHLKGDDLTLVMTSFGLEIDLLNIQWIYRAKKYLKLANTEIYKIIIPINHKLKHNQIVKLVEADSLATFQQELKTTYYGNKIATIENYSLEEVFGQLQEKLYNLDSRKKPYSVAVIKSYLYHKEKEVQKLTTALECIRYGYEPKEIARYLQMEV